MRAASSIGYPYAPVEIEGKLTDFSPLALASSRLERYADARSSGSPCLQSRYIGPTAWMTFFAARRPAPVIRASPVGQPPIFRHSSMIVGPPVRWMAPSTPPPPRRDEL